MQLGIEHSKGFERCVPITLKRNHASRVVSFRNHEKRVCCLPIIHFQWVYLSKTLVSTDAMPGGLPALVVKIHRPALPTGPVAGAALARCLRVPERAMPPAANF